MKTKEIKKVSARLLANGRATLIHSEADYDFNSLPVGSILINNDNNKIKIKLEGKSDWSDIKEEMSSRSYLTILGNRILQEPFLVTDIDFEKNEIIYYNHRGERRIKYIYTDKKWKYAVFELDKATYTPKKNAIVAHINNIVECNTENYKLQEITPRRIGIDIRWLAVGCWVDIAYYDIFRMRSVGREIFAANNSDGVKNNTTSLVYDNLDKEGYPRLSATVREDPSNSNHMIVKVVSEKGSTITVGDVINIIDRNNVVKIIEGDGYVEFGYKRTSKDYVVKITSTKPGKIKELTSVKIPKRGVSKVFKFLYMLGRTQFRKIRKIVKKKIITPEPELILGTAVFEREKSIVTSSDVIGVQPASSQSETDRRRREQEETDRRRREQEETERREKEEAERRRNEEAERLKSEEMSRLKNEILPLLKLMKEKIPQKIDQYQGLSSTQKEELKQKVNDYYNKIINAVTSTNDISKLNSIKQELSNVNPYQDTLEFSFIKTNKFLEILKLSGNL